MDWSKLLLITVLLSFVELSSAYTVSNHDDLTQIAVNKFNRCVEEQEGLSRYSVINEEIQRKLVEKNLFEDLMSIGDRARRWHFWDPSRRNERSKIFHKHFHGRFDEVENLALDPNSTISQVYDSVGHMFHYLQDVTVPAHVVPIFHPAPPLFRKDRFDAYDIDFYALENSSENNCDELADPELVEGYNEILNDASRLTLSRTKELIPVLGNSTRTWEAYWNKPKKKKRFGKYGKFGNKFGRDKEFKCSGGKCNIRKNTFDNFALRQHRLAIDATVKALFLTQQILSERRN